MPVDWVGSISLKVALVNMAYQFLQGPSGILFTELSKLFQSAMGYMYLILEVLAYRKNLKTELSHHGNTLSNGVHCWY